MSAERISLAYEQPERVPQRLTLERTVDGAVLQFPPLKRWLVWTQIGCSLITGAFTLLGMVYIVRGFARLGLATAFLRSTWLVISMHVLAVIVWLSIATIEIVQDRRYGRVGTRLTVDARQFTLTRRGVLRIRRHAWPLTEIRLVEFRPLTSVIPNLTAGELFICIRGHWLPLRFRGTGEKVLILREYAALMTRAVADAKTVDDSSAR
jgi:hypothetical protein